MRKPSDKSISYKLDAISKLKSQREIPAQFSAMKQSSSWPAFKAFIDNLIRVQEVIVTNNLSEESDFEGSSIRARVANGKKENLKSIMVALENPENLIAEINSQIRKLEEDVKSDRAEIDDTIIMGV